jgi:hypothetical protein
MWMSTESVSQRPLNSRTKVAFHLIWPENGDMGYPEALIKQRWSSNWSVDIPSLVDVANSIVLAFHTAMDQVHKHKKMMKEKRVFHELEADLLLISLICWSGRNETIKSFNVPAFRFFWTRLTLLYNKAEANDQNAAM